MAAETAMAAVQAVGVERALWAVMPLVALQPELVRVALSDYRKGVCSADDLERLFGAAGTAKREGRSGSWGQGG